VLLDLFHTARFYYLAGAASLSALFVYATAGRWLVKRLRPRPPDVLIQWGDAPGASLSQLPLDERTPDGPRWTKIHVGYRVENAEASANVYDVTTGGATSDGRECQLGPSCPVLRPGDDRLFDGDIPADLVAANRDAEPQRAYSYWIRLRDSQQRRWRGVQAPGQHRPTWRRAR
jgi:hypothetical protein